MKTKRQRVTVGLGIILLTVCMTVGCNVSPMFADIRDELLSQIPDAEFESGVSFSLGPTLLGAARLGLRFVDDKEVATARHYLVYIDRVEVAAYEAKNELDIGSVTMPEWIQRRLTKNGWKVVAKVKERTERTWILYRGDGRNITELFIVALEERELAMVRVHGRLDLLVKQAIEDHHEIIGVLSTKQASGG